MIKRFAALLLALMLLTGMAAAEELSPTPIATYTLPTGAEAVHVWDAGVWEAPEGLSEMYRIMQNASVNGDVYLVRMAHGRALVSVSCTQPEQARTAEELLALWPQIARSIAKEGVSVNADAACAAVKEMFGFQALVIDTQIGLGEPGADMQLDAQGIAFMRGDELLEVWAVAPAEGSYPGEAETAELEADRADLASFMQSLSFTGLEDMAVEGAPYLDPDGRFALLIPAGSTVITRATPQDEIASARQAYLSAHGTGAEAFFDEYMRDVMEQNVVVAIAQDQQVVAEFFAEQTEDFRDVTMEQLQALAQPIQQSLSQKFEAALLLTGSEQAIISGSKHAWLGYWLRSGEVNAQLDILAAVLEDAWLYEVDIYTHGNQQDARSLWYMFITQTMQYTPLANALD